MRRSSTFLSTFAVVSVLARGADVDLPAARPLDVPGPLAAPLAAGSGFEEDKRPINIRIEMQAVAVPAGLAVPLIADLKKKEKIEAAYGRIQEMLEKGTAQLLGWPIVNTKSGQRATMGGIQELIYATEFDPPVVSVKESPGGSENVKATKVDVTQLDGIPTAFTTRNVGVTLEVEATLGADGKTIGLSLAPRHVRLKGFRKVAVEKPATHSKAVVEMPEFEVNSVNTSITVTSGQLVLLGVYPISDPPKHVELFILKAEAIPVE